MSGALDGLEVLLDDLRQEDPEIRITGMRKLRLAANSIGVARTRTELLPLLQDHLEDDDEVLLGMAEELSLPFVPLVGGPEAAHELLRPLASLATVEETVVRDKAVESASGIISVLPAADVAAYAVPMVQQLTTGDWFTARVSAAGLFAPVYARLNASPAGSAAAASAGEKAAVGSAGVSPLGSASLNAGGFPAAGAGAAAAAAGGGGGGAPPAATAAAASIQAGPSEYEEHRSKLRQLFFTLCGDDTPMVRRAAAKAIGGLAGVVEHSALVGDLISWWNQLVSDDQDSVRLLAVENAKAFAAVLTPAENGAHILPLVRACSGDKSWRVRQAITRDFAALSNALGAEVTQTELVPLFQRLLSDPEAEVRSSAARNCAAVVSLLSPEQYQRDLARLVEESISDPAQSVRVAIAGSLTSLTGGLAGSPTVVTGLLPLILRALRDEAPEVRLAVLEGLKGVAHVLGATALEAHLLPALTALGSDPLWRVREKAIMQLPLLATSLGPSIFAEKLLPLYAACFQDQVHAVRLAATRCLAPLAHSLGQDWTRERLLPHLRALFEAQGSPYLQRITVLYALRSLCSDVAMAALAEDALPLLLAAAQDPVPNVRFVAAQVIAEALGGGPVGNGSSAGGSAAPGSAYAGASSGSGGEMDVSFGDGGQADNNGAFGGHGQAHSVFSRARVAADIQPQLLALAEGDPDFDVRYFATIALERAAAV